MNSETRSEFFNAANTDNEIPRAFFVNHQWSDHNICYSVTRNVNSYTKFLTILNCEITLAICHE